MLMVQTADQSRQPIFAEYKSPTDWPWTISLMISESRRILSYLTNLPKKAQPPKSIWHSPDKCSEFIESNLGFSDKPQEMLEFEDPELQ